MFEQVVQDALSLKESKRAELAHRLLLSLENIAATYETEEVWLNEVESRIQAVEDGQEVLISSDQVHAEVEKHLNANKL